MRLGHTLLRVIFSQKYILIYLVHTYTLHHNAHSQMPYLANSAVVHDIQNGAFEAFLDANQFSWNKMITLRQGARELLWSSGGGKCLPGGQGNPYPKLKISRIWLTIFYRETQVHVQKQTKIKMNDIDSRHVHGSQSRIYDPRRSLD